MNTTQKKPWRLDWRCSEYRPRIRLTRHKAPERTRWQGSTPNKNKTAGAAAAHLLHADDAAGEVRVVMLAFLDSDAGGRIPEKCQGNMT